MGVSTTTHDDLARPVVAIFNVAMIGHVNPTFPLVMELARRGCKVHYFLPPDEDIRRAARESGAEVEAYLSDDPQDFVLERCGVDEIPEMPESDRVLYEASTWPLASTLLCGSHVIRRCRELGVQVVLYDPKAPHGLLAASALQLPCLSLVTFPGLGSVSQFMSDSDRLLKLQSVRTPLSQKIKDRFGVDLQGQLLSRVQYFAEENLVTTSDDLTAPLPAVGETLWADEVREHFRFQSVGCMIDERAPHVASTRPKSAAKAAEMSDYGRELPLQELEAAKARGSKVVYAALGTMALSDRWDTDLGMASGGNLPMGTTGKAFCQHVWRALLKAFADLGQDYFCLLCVGTQPDALDFLDGAEVELPSNVVIRSSAPQVAMLRSYADVFVSHVGFNSLQESVIAGVPLIAVPQAVDQPANACQVERSGWGRAFLRPMESVTSDVLREALLDVASETAPYRGAMEASQGMLQGGERRAADRLLELISLSHCQES